MTRHRTVENRNEVQRQERADRQTTDNDDTQRLPHLGTFTAGHSHRHHTEDRSECGHQDRTNTTTTGHRDRFVQFVPALTHEVNIVHEHNTVLHHNTDEQYNTQRADHIQRTTGEPQCEDHTRESRNNGEHDDSRHAQRLKLRSHRDIDEQNNERHEQNHVSKGLLLVFVRTGEVNRVAGRQVQLRKHIRFDIRSQLTQRSLIRGHFDGDDTLTALTLNGRRSPVLTDRCYLRQFHFGTGRCRNSEVEHIGDRVTVLFLKTYHDIVLRTVILKVAAVHTGHTVT